MEYNYLSFVINNGNIQPGWYFRRYWYVKYEVCHWAFACNQQGYLFFVIISTYCANIKLVFHAYGSHLASEKGISCSFTTPMNIFMYAYSFYAYLYVFTHGLIYCGYKYIKCNQYHTKETGISPWMSKWHLKCFAWYIDGISIQIWLWLLSMNLSVFVALNLKNNRQNPPFV